jgi:hypothetical protein
MAFGANSKIFSSYIHDVLGNVTAMDIDTDALIECALFNDTITPNQVDTSAHNAYAGSGGSWASGGVVDTGSSAPAGWPAIGRPLAWSSATRWSTFAATTAKFDADDTVSANAVTTLTNAYGCLIYDDTITTPVADQGICYLSFGGANSVTLGTFTVVYNAAGIMSIAM